MPISKLCACFLQCSYPGGQLSDRAHDYSKLRLGSLPNMWTTNVRTCLSPRFTKLSPKGLVGQLGSKRACTVIRDLPLCINVCWCCCCCCVFVVVVVVVIVVVVVVVFVVAVVVVAVNVVVVFVFVVVIAVVVVVVIVFNRKGSQGHRVHAY